MLLTLLSFTAACAEHKDTQYKEGVHYTKISEQLSSKPEVREYFSFYCPHCFQFEPTFATIKKQLPEGVKFERNHVDFLRMASQEVQFMLTKALVVAQVLNVEEKITSALFDFIHVQKGTISNEKDIRNILVLQGVDGAKFDKLFNSFAVNSKAKLMKKNQQTLAEKRALTGVPAVFVNGKYRINMQELDRDNFEQDYVNLIAYITQLDK